MIFLLAGPLLAEEPKAAEPTPPARPKVNVEPCAVEVRLADGSVLKVTLREDKFNVATKFGKLAIPVADVYRIEFATRISDDVAKIEASASAEVLEVRKEDVIHTTNDMKIKGQIENVIFKTDSSALGAGQLKLADMRTLRSLLEITNSIGMKLVLIPAGKFLMGSPKDEKGRVADEEQHEVEITKPFHMGVYTMTVGQFRQFVKDSGYQTEAEKDGEGGVGYNAGIKTYEGRKPHFNWKNTGFEQTDEHPVVNVTWNDAVAFCDWLSNKEGKTYRLPTEAEWEYSCRAGTKTRFYSGDDVDSLKAVANIGDASFKEKNPGRIGR